MGEEPRPQIIHKNLGAIFRRGGAIVSVLSSHHDLSFSIIKRKHITLEPKPNYLTMTDLLQKTSTEDDCTTDCYSSVTKSVDYSVIITAVRPTGYDHQVEDDNFSVARIGDLSRHAEDLKDLCDDNETRLLLFQSSLDLFSDVRGPKPKSEQVEVSPCPINKTVTKAETIDETPKETPKPEAQMKKKRSALKSCLRVRVEQGTCSTDEDVTAELSLKSGRGKSVDFSDVTVRTFACRLGDNPSASKYTTS